MKFSLMALPILLGITATGFSQTTTCKWGVSRYVVTNPEDSTVLVDAEKKMWKIEREQNAFRIYEGFFGGGGYNVGVSKQAMEWSFADSSIAKVKFLNVAEFLSLWNNHADTCWIIGYQSMIEIERDHKKFQEKDWKDTTCYVHIPFYHYRAFLETGEAKKLHELMLNTFAGELRASRSGDTLFRTVTFRDDSNGYLPQATYRHLGEMMKNGMLSGELRAYREASLTTPLSKRSLEESFSYWDSLFTYEDPRHPGVRVQLPIKRQESVVGIVLFEKWVPALCPEEEFKYPYLRPQPYLKYVRKVMAYGLRLTSGKILWTAAAQFDAFFKTGKFYWLPYEECFRAERFETMHIALEP